MKPSSGSDFNKNYQSHLKHLCLKGLQPKTISAYSRAIRRIGAYFDHEMSDLSEAQLRDYFSDLLETHSWSSGGKAAQLPGRLLRYPLLP